jgi:hypothetical protein
MLPGLLMLPRVIQVTLVTEEVTRVITATSVSTWGNKDNKGFI